MKYDFVKEVLVTHDEIVKYCQKIAQQLETEYQNEEIVLVCVLKGSVPFTAELLKNFKRTDIMCEFVRASSYDGETVESSGNVEISCDTLVDANDKVIILVEDILDTGRTLFALKEHFMNRNAKAVKTLTLLDKPERREIDIAADYVGFSIPNYFVVGFGLDYAEKYRNLPDIIIPYPEKL